MGNRDDQKLLDAVARGETSAFEQIYRTYKDDLLTAADILLMGDRAAAEDVLHEVFIAFVRRATQLKLRSSLRNYLLTSCLNRARDLLRIRRRETQHTSTLAEHPTLITNPATRVGLDDEIQRLSQALRTLPDEQREVVTLHIHGQMKFREIAEMLDFSINTVQSRYRYALAALRTKLAQSEVANEE